MRRTKKQTLSSATASSGGAGSLRAVRKKASWWQPDFHWRRSAMHLTDRELAFLLRNLATLTQNGVSLPKALGTLAEEKSLEKHRELILAVRRRLENGESFSAALTQVSAAFDVIVVNQVKVGEHSGTLPETLDKIASRCEQAHQLQAEIVRKLAYPVILIVAGSIVITFLLMFVVPVFQETYDKADVPLPLITRWMIALGNVARDYGLVLVALAAGGVVGLHQLRKRADFANRMDRAILRWPLVGHWLRDIAVLQVMEVLGSLLDAGFTLADALGETVQAVDNRAVQRAVRDLQSAVRRGERFSRELERHGKMFPPIVSQLVIVGEQTGKLTGATTHICVHLKREIERKTTLLVGALEPTLTIFLASAVALILLAIYLPMFDMIHTISD